MRGTITRFPETYAGIETRNLLDAYQAGPQRLQRAISGLTSDEMCTRVAPRVWTIQEVVAHLADSELIGAARIRLVLAQPGATFFGYDQDGWARTFHYQELSENGVALALRQFEVLRSTTLPLLRDAAAADWHAVGIHPEHGTVTLRNLLELYADHSERHIAQIVERRGALGRPLDLEPLLHDRLY